MSSLNAVTVVGHLGRKPELHYTATQAAYALLSVATNETFLDRDKKPQERTEWHRIVAWGRTANACAQHLDVGRQVLVRGRLRTRSWTDREGVQRWTTEIAANRIVFLGGRDKQARVPDEQIEPPPPDDAPASAEEDIPF